MDCKLSVLLFCVYVLSLCVYMHSSIYLRSVSHIVIGMCLIISLLHTTPVMQLHYFCILYVLITRCLSSYCFPSAAAQSNILTGFSVTFEVPIDFFLSLKGSWTDSCTRSGCDNPSSSHQGKCTCCLTAATLIRNRWLGLSSKQVQDIQHISFLS